MRTLIAAALAFVVLLVASLRGSKKAASGSAAAGQAPSAGLADVPAALPGEVPVDPEALARARIEELVRTDPRRVGEILSRWAGEGAPARN